MRALFASSSALNFSASCTIFSISSADRRPFSFLIVILFSLPVDFSTADTFRMPSASMSNVTSICGCHKARHAASEECRPDGTCPAGCCPSSSTARPRTPESARPAGCPSTSRTPASSSSESSCYAESAPSSRRPPSPDPTTAAPHPAAAGRPACCPRPCRSAPPPAPSRRTPRPRRG